MTESALIGLVTSWFLTFCFCGACFKLQDALKLKIVFSFLFTVLAMLHKLQVDFLRFEIPSAQKGLGLIWK